MNRIINLILLGAPGAGKGTQAEIISAEYGIPSISTGAIIREAIKNSTEMGKSAKSYIDKGQLVPDEVVIGIIKERLVQSDCQKGFILDGFPRTVPQAEALDQMGVNITDVISIEVPDEKILERMSGRRVCPSCGATYHIVSKPSSKGEYCDNCGEKLTIRSDDKPEVVSSRLVVYHTQTEPIKEYYSKKGLVKCVVGQNGIQETTKYVFEALNSKN